MSKIPDPRFPIPVRGFTLVEVIVAAFLITVGALSALQLLSAVGRLGAGSRQILRSADVAARRIETVRAGLAGGGACSSGGGLVAWGTLAERWTTATRPSGLALAVETIYRRDGRWVVDSVGTEFPCP